MKVTTFYWQGKPFDMVLVNSSPHPLDFSGYSLFAFDGLALLVLADIITPYDAARATYCMDAGHSIDHATAEMMFTTFTQDDIVTEGAIRRITPSISIRVHVLEIQKQLAFGGLDSATKEFVHVNYCQKNSLEFVTEKTLAAALSKITKQTYNCKTIRALLVERGYLTVKRTGGRSRYELSKQGAGYGVSGFGRERHWHLSIIKLLEEGA